MHTADDNTPTQAPEEAQPMDKRESDDSEKQTWQGPKQTDMQGTLKGRVQSTGDGNHHKRSAGQPPMLPINAPGSKANKMRPVNGKGKARGNS